MLIAVSLALIAVCLLPAAGKLTEQPRFRASADRFGIAWERYRLIGFAELAAAAGVVVGVYVRPVGVAAGLCLGVLLVGALFTHRRAGDTGRELMPALLALAVDALYLAVALAG